MRTHTPYPIGTPGLPWGEAEVAGWRSRQTIKRSYDARSEEHTSELQSQ